MAFSKNQAEVIGFLGADPVLRYTPNGKAVCDISVATNSYYKDANGESHTDTEWIRCTLWGRDAENASQYLHKGSQVHVEGRIKTDKVGEGDTAKYYTKVVCTPGRLGFIGGNGVPQAATEGEQVPEGDIPF
jgi:single-strand DNA-binding protein